MENAEKAMLMAFAVFILVIALTLSMYMLSKVSSTSETLAFYSDSTIYYDNVELLKECPACNEENPVGNPICDNCKNTFPDNSADENKDIQDGTVRIVSAETIIPTLYRYYKENFCVKIYGAKDASGERKLIQIFDMDLEGFVNEAANDTLATASSIVPKQIRNYAYSKVYNDPSKPYYMFGVPWLSSPEAVKTRIDLFIDGEHGYINNVSVDYRNNDYYQARIQGKQFKERFISYSYTGQTMITEDGDELTTGSKSKDKIVIIYTLMD